MTRTSKNLLLLALLAAAAPAQITYMGIGSGVSSPFGGLFPGDLTTLFASGLNLRFPKPLVASMPPPTSLGGISVRIQQDTANYTVPLFSIYQFSRCASATTDECFVTGITIQLPFELGKTYDNASIVIAANGVTSQAFTIGFLRGGIHVLTSCDAMFAASPIYWYPQCGQLVTHADGTPAQYVTPGETIVIYATGLLMDPSTAPVTGAITPIPAPQASFSIRNVTFQLGQNAGATYPWIGNCAGACAAASTAPGQPSAAAWLAPGQIGIYQINITLPNYTAADLFTACLLQPDSFGVNSNLTIGLVSSQYVTAVPLCMPVLTEQPNHRRAKK